MKKVSIMGMGALGLMYGTLIKKTHPRLSLPMWQTKIER